MAERRNRAPWLPRFLLLMAVIIITPPLLVDVWGSFISSPSFFLFLLRDFFSPSRKKTLWWWGSLTCSQVCHTPHTWCTFSSLPGYYPAGLFTNSRINSEKIQDLDFGSRLSWPSSSRCVSVYFHFEAGSSIGQYRLLLDMVSSSCLPSWPICWNVQIDDVHVARK